jgi:hypothetical protein
MRGKLPIVLSVTALVVAVLGTTGPAIAHGVQHALFAHNADKVDGRHAVGATAGLGARKGKLVATSAATGRLPNDIIQKAPDAETLDGVDSSGFYAAGSTVADADQLDGVDSSGFVQGGGKVYQQVFRPSAYVNYNLLGVPGFGSLLGGCNASGQFFFDFHNTSGETLDVMVDDGGANPTHQTIANSTNPYVGTPFSSTNERMILQLSRGTRMATLVVSGHGVPTGTSAVNCFINAMAVTN